MLHAGPRRIRWIPSLIWKWRHQRVIAPVAAKAVLPGAEGWFMLLGVGTLHPSRMKYRLPWHLALTPPGL
jgi:hypothetical protein